MGNGDKHKPSASSAENQVPIFARATEKQIIINKEQDEPGQKGDLDDLPLVSRQLLLRPHAMIILNAPAGRSTSLFPRRFFRNGLVLPPGSPGPAYYTIQRPFFRPSPYCQRSVVLQVAVTPVALPAKKA
jgi:hypothetical protein